MGCYILEKPGLGQGWTGLMPVGKNKKLKKILDRIFADSGSSRFYYSEIIY